VFKSGFAHGFRVAIVGDLKPKAPSPAAPFVLLARDGRAEQAFPTLKDAVAKAHNGDAIEVRGDGPFVIDERIVVRRALRICAAPGACPVFRMGAKATGALILAQAPLVLEGLVFDGTAAEYQQDMLRRVHVSADRGPLLLANCRLTVNGPSHSIRGTASLLEVRNCDLNSTPWGQLYWIAPKSGQLVLTNNLIRARGISVEFEPGQTRSPSVELTQNTWSTTFWCLEFTTGRPLTPGADGHLVQVRATGNVISGPAVALNQSQDKAQAPGEAAALLKRLVNWEGERNLFNSRSGLLTFGHKYKTQDGAPRVGNLDEWRELWGRPEKESLQAAVEFQGGEMSDRPDRMPPSRFRLAPGSPGQGGGPGGKDLGADVDRVGPGKPYDEWRKTPEYEAWQKKVREIMAAK
jgi:hypothetical protein